MKKWGFVFLLLFLIPLISADVIFPFLQELYLSYIYGWLFIPIVIIESLIVYIFLRKYEFNFWKSLGITTIANVISAIVGFILSANEKFAGAIEFYKGDWILSEFAWIAILILVILTIIIEAIPFYIFIKKKSKKPIAESFIISLTINIVSYVLILVWVIFYH